MLTSRLVAAGRARVNTAQALVQAIDDEVLSRFGPHLYRRLHDAGMISHRCAGSAAHIHSMMMAL